MLLIIGLGNKGKSYENTRHNIGRVAVDCLISKLNAFVHSTKILEWAETEISHKRVILAKLNTFMNTSGEATVKIMKKFKTIKSNLIILSDDLDLPLGKIRIKKKGGSAGHKGIQSIIDQIGNEFIRVRIGIDKPLKKEYTSKYVLSNFTKREKPILTKAVKAAVLALESIIKDGAGAAMNEFN